MQALSFYRIPLFLLPIYQAAAAHYGVPWQILAAINEIETNYGTDLSVSSAGAEGWMQFMPATWMQYGVDALDAGYADPYNPVDAIFAAARYLRAAGAQSDLRAAIMAYNHSSEYVDSVLLRAKLISAYPKLVIGTLTGLIDARLPIAGKLSAGALSTITTSSATASAHKASHAPSPAPAQAQTPGSLPAPTPAAAAAAVGGSPAAPQREQLLQLNGSPRQAAVAVQDGSITALGHSHSLGNYVVLRDLYGDQFTYAGLGSVAHSYQPAKAQGGGQRVRRSSADARHRLPLRVGSVVSQGTVLGHLRVPAGAKDGHMRFAIRPAGDAGTIDPRPILAGWKQLYAAEHLQGAKSDTSLRAARTSIKLARPPRTRGAFSASFPAGSGLTPAQWDALIARISTLRAPTVAVKPSAGAIPDPQASPNASGWAGLSPGGSPPAGSPGAPTPGISP
jgi:hypothetical protein